MDTNELKYWNAFKQIPQIGPMRFKKLYTYFKSLEYAWKASEKELEQANLEKEVVERIYDLRKKISPEKKWEKIEKEKIKIVTIKDKFFPKLLKEIYSPPPLLYYKGEFEKTDEFSVAVVGTRKISSYGKQVTQDIVEGLAKNKITVISGLAQGVDTIAHKSSLENNGRTIAVLGSGLDQQSIFPRANYALAREISESGVLVSEYPIDFPALRQNFPTRNRIISGLALGVVVIEAPEQSGALITANLALEQNRQVFAVPGSIYSKNSQGTNELIKMGAKAVSSAKDILEDLNLALSIQYVENKQIIAETKEEAIILEHLSKEPVHVNQIIKSSKLSSSLVLSTLTLMEMKGKIKNLGGTNYVVSR